MSLCTTGAFFQPGILTESVTLAMSLHPFRGDQPPAVANAGIARDLGGDGTRLTATARGPRSSRLEAHMRKMTQTEKQFPKLKR